MGRAGIERATLGLRVAPGVQTGRGRTRCTRMESAERPLGDLLDIGPSLRVWLSPCYHRSGSSHPVSHPSYSPPRASINASKRASVSANVSSSTTARRAQEPGVRGGVCPIDARDEVLARDFASGGLRGSPAPEVEPSGHRDRRAAFRPSAECYFVPGERERGRGPRGARCFGRGAGMGEVGRLLGRTRTLDSHASRPAES